MALTERTVLAKVEILPDSGIIQIKEHREILDGETVIARMVQRKVIEPEGNTAPLGPLAAIVQHVWTPDVVARFKTRRKGPQQQPAPTEPVT